MISKEEFIEIIDRLREVNDFVEETNEKARELRESMESDCFNAMSLAITHEGTVVKLLERIFKTDIISWWIYELDYGREYKKGCIQEGNGKNIDVSTAEKLYDYLIKDMEG